MGNRGSGRNSHYLSMKLLLVVWKNWRSKRRKLTNKENRQLLTAQTPEHAFFTLQKNLIFYLTKNRQPVRREMEWPTPLQANQSRISPKQLIRFECHCTWHGKISLSDSVKMIPVEFRLKAEFISFSKVCMLSYKIQRVSSYGACIYIWKWQAKVCQGL